MTARMFVAGLRSRRDVSRPPAARAAGHFVCHASMILRSGRHAPRLLGGSLGATILVLFAATSVVGGAVVISGAVGTCPRGRHDANTGDED